MGTMVAEDLEDDPTKAFSDDELSAACATLMDQGKSPIRIAHELGLHPRRAMRLCARIDEIIGDGVMALSKASIVGQLAGAAYLASERLADEGRWKDFWTVRREFNHDLARLGVVRNAPSELNVKHSMDEAARKEFERMRELEQKREAREEEIKRAKVDLIDPMPQIGTQDPSTHNGTETEDGDATPE